MLIWQVKMSNESHGLSLFVFALYKHVVWYKTIISSLFPMNKKNIGVFLNCSFNQQFFLANIVSSFHWKPTRNSYPLLIALAVTVHWVNKKTLILMNKKIIYFCHTFNYFYFGIKNCLKHAFLPCLYECFNQFQITWLLVLEKTFATIDNKESVHCH